MDTLSPCGVGLTDTENKSAAELRKQNKPLMEKRRRARINDSLNKLKGLVLDAMKRDTSRYSKLEKADILEMTVKHLRTVQRQQMAVAMANDASVINKYRAGFVECASEVTRYLSSIDGLDPAVRSRLLTHLTDCTHKVAGLSGLQEPQHTATQPIMQPMHIQIPSATPLTSLPGSGYTGSVAAPASSAPALISATSNVNTMSVSPPSDPRISGSFQMVPGSIPAGQYALLVPANNGGYSLSGSAPGSYSSLNNNVHPSNNANINDNRTPMPPRFGSVSTATTSPGVTSPMSVTSSEGVFRYGSASEAGSSDEEELEVALDMRVEPCRDVNANIIKPGPSQVDYNRISRSPGTSNGSMQIASIPMQGECRNALLVHNVQRPAVKAEAMWRPW